MNERYDDWSLTQEEMELMNYLDSKRRLIKSRVRQLQLMESFNSDEDYCDYQTKGAFLTPRRLL